MRFQFSASKGAEVCCSTNILLSVNSNKKGRFYDKINPYKQTLVEEAPNI